MSDQITNISDTARVTVRKTGWKRTAVVQIEEEGKWKDKSKRTYEMDIRIDPVDDMARVGRQMGWISNEDYDAFLTKKHMLLTEV